MLPHHVGKERAAYRFENVTKYHIKLFKIDPILRCTETVKNLNRHKQEQKCRQGIWTWVTCARFTFGHYSSLVIMKIALRGVRTDHEERPKIVRLAHQICRFVAFLFNDNREFKIYDAATNFAYLMRQNKSFARPSRAFTISVHFFPVLVKSATWNDHFSSFTENVNTQPPIWIFFKSKFSSWVVPLAFKSYWHNDGKDGQAWICNFERRFRYRRVVDLKLPNVLWMTFRQHDL